MNLRNLANSILYDIGWELATAQDEGVQSPMTDLERHDAKYHPDGYEEGDTCKYRKELEKGDVVDRLDPENVEGEEIQYKKFTKGNHTRKGQTSGESSNHENGETVNPGDGSPPNSPSAKEIADSFLKHIDEFKEYVDNVFSAYEKAYQQEMDNGSLNGLSKEDENQVSAWLGNIKDANVRSGLGELVKECIKNMKPKIPTPERLRMEGICRFADASGVDLRSAIGSGGSYGKDNQRIRELKAEKKECEAKIDEMREMMKLASPTFAVEMEKAIGAMKASLKEIDDELAGKKPKAEKGQSEKAENKDKKNEKEEPKAPHKGYALDSLKDVSAKTASVLGTDDFKSIYDKLPEADRVLAVSDLHETDWKKKLKFKGRGTVLIAGDLGDSGSTSISKGVGMKKAVEKGMKWIKEEFLPYLESHKDQQFVIMPGNRDHYMSDPEFATLQFPSNVTFVQDRAADVNGMKIYGMPWCEQRKTGTAGGLNMADPQEREQYYDHPVGKRPFEISDEKLKEWCDKVPTGLDVLMVHYPPKFDGYDGDTAGGAHCGSEIVADMIKRVKPKMVICGHLHDGDHRPFKVDGTTVVNVAYSTDANGSHHGAGGYHARKIGAIRDGGQTGFILNGEKDMRK